MSPKTKQQFEEIRRLRTERIKEVALELFAHYGFHSTSISQIARSAGVSKGLMYNYFESKEALLEAIIMDAVEGGEEMMAPFLDKVADPREQLKGLTDATLNMVRDNFEYWKLLTALALQPGVLKGLEPYMEKKQEEMMPKFVHLFEQMGAEDPEKEAYFFGAVLDGMMLHYFQMKDSYPLEEIKGYVLKQFKILEK